MADNKVLIAKHTLDFYVAEMRATHKLLTMLGAPQAVQGEPGAPVVHLTPSQRLQRYINQLAESAADERPHAPH